MNNLLFYYIKLVRYKNNHISPTEIEALLQTHDSVLECLVYGKPDNTVQELISAVVVLKPGAEVKINSHQNVNQYDRKIIS